MKQADTWKPLYRTGAVAALTAAVLFRRNIGAEVSLFTGIEMIPTNAADWFSLLQSNPFVGLSFLAVFDLANYFLVGLVFLALAATLWPVGKSRAALALAAGLDDALAAGQLAAGTPFPRGYACGGRPAVSRL